MMMTWAAAERDDERSAYARGRSRRRAAADAERDDERSAYARGRRAMTSWAAAEPQRRNSSSY